MKNLAKKLNLTGMSKTAAAVLLVENALFQIFHVQKQNAKEVMKLFLNVRYYFLEISSICYIAMHRCKYHNSGPQTKLPSMEVTTLQKKNIVLKRPTKPHINRILVLLQKFSIMIQTNGPSEVILFTLEKDINCTLLVEDTVENIDTPSGEKSLCGRMEIILLPLRPLS